MRAWVRSVVRSTGSSPKAEAQLPQRPRRSKYVPEEDNYDPARPEHLLPAAPAEIEDMERLRLDLQIARLQTALTRRSGSDPQVALHYANVLDELYGERLQLQCEDLAAEPLVESEDFSAPEPAGNPFILDSCLRARSCSAWNLELDGPCKSGPSEPEPAWSDEGMEAPAASDSEADWPAAKGDEAEERRATSSTAASDLDWERQEEQTPDGSPCNPWLADLPEVKEASVVVAHSEECMHSSGTDEALSACVYSEAGCERPAAVAGATAPAAGVGAACGGWEQAGALASGAAEAQAADCARPSRATRSQAAALSPQVGCCGLREVFYLLTSSQRRST